MNSNALPTPVANKQDKLDLLLSTFLKGQMKQPWPAAPMPMPPVASTMTVTEPSVLVASRNAAAQSVEAPRNQPATAGRNSGSKSRYTLAASVALLLGTCWTLSNGFQPGERATPASQTGPGAANVFSDASASNPDVLKKVREDKAKEGNANKVFDPTKLDPFK